MSDFCTDACMWEHFVDNLSPWQRDVFDLVDYFRLNHLGQRVKRSEILSFLHENGANIENEKWFDKLMQYLSASGFANPVFGGWVFSNEY